MARIGSQDQRGSTSSRKGLVVRDALHSKAGSSRVQVYTILHTLTTCLEPSYSWYTVKFSLQVTKRKIDCQLKNDGTM